MAKTQRDFQLPPLPSGDSAGALLAVETQVTNLERQIEVLRALPRTSPQTTSRLVGTTEYLRKQLRHAQLVMQQLRNSTL